MNFNILQDAPSTSQGRYAGISQESINCVAEQIGADISGDAASNLAEDLSYKLRQLINVRFLFITCHFNHISIKSYYRILDSRVLSGGELATCQ